MVVLAWSLRRSLGGRSVRVWLLRNRVRGWNEPDLDAVADARWALDRVRSRQPGAGVVLVGHSLGGRVALRLAGEPGVRGVCALAPWVVADEPVEQLRGKPVLVAHGDDDDVTSAAASADFVHRAQRLGAATVSFLRVPCSGHAMVRRWSEWHALTRRFVSALAAGEPRRTA